MLCWPCTSVHIRSPTDTVLSCTLHSIHIFLCHIHTGQRSTVVSGSQQHITVTTSSPTLVPLSSAGHSLLDNYSSTSLHSQLRNVFLYSVRTNCVQTILYIICRMTWRYVTCMHVCNTHVYSHSSVEHRRLQSEAPGSIPGSCWFSQFSKNIPEPFHHA